MTNYKKDEIYIDCQPVNSEGNTLVEVKQNKKEEEDTTTEYLKMFNSPFIGFLIGVIILYVLLKIFNVTITKLNTTVQKISKTTTSGNSGN